MSLADMMRAKKEALEAEIDLATARNTALVHLINDACKMGCPDKVHDLLTTGTSLIMAAKTAEEVAGLFSVFSKVEIGSASADLFDPEKRSAWFLVYAIK